MLESETTEIMEQLFDCFAMQDGGTKYFKFKSLLEILKENPEGEYTEKLARIIDSFLGLIHKL